MTSKIRGVFLIFMLLFSSIMIELLYLSSKENHFDKKRAFVKTVGLPDLSISTEANFIRHRSLANMMDIYKDDADMRVYFPSSFALYWYQALKIKI